MGRKHNKISIIEKIELLIFDPFLKGLGILWYQVIWKIGQVGIHGIGKFLRQDLNITIGM